MWRIQKTEGEKEERGERGSSLRERGKRERERDKRDTGLCNPLLAAFTRGDERAVNSPARTKAAANRLCPRGTPRCH